ncbi:MAG: LysR family transcriptional regulator [Gammaproteobacteria bacterium]|nr:LysR family transcriptional regulator [Gammaproteobacteria bacterium]MCI0590540.1 LysR family transcriptional regulator [Gammaproteobacteria bacterium]
MDKLTSMKVFTHIAKAKTFAGAAEHLGMSRAMVSKHVLRLENSLGVRLLNRTTRRLSLTEVGTAYYERCVQILAEVEETELSVTQLNSEPRGTLKILSPTSFGTFHLAPAIADFIVLYPDMKVELTLNDRPIDLAEEGLDLAIRVGKLPDSSLIARLLAPTRMVVCGSPEYLKRHGEPKDPQDLTHHNCLLYSYRSPPDEWDFNISGRLCSVRVSGSLKSHVGDALRLAAIHGLGLILQPTYMVGQDLQLGRLQAVLADFQPTAKDIYAIYPHRRHLSKKVRAFVEFLQARFQPTPYWDNWQT